MVVSATRTPVSADHLPVSVTVFAPSELEATAALTLDDVLREDPAFSLFRRNSSLSANPTAQGVSLRGVGPSGASRSLVLLDGVPLNDPFGGWVQWSQVPRLSLSHAEIVHGGGSGAWGNAALGGVIALDTASDDTTAGSAAEFEYGSESTRSGEVSLNQNLGNDHVRVDARAFATDGFYSLDPADRGSVDRPLASRHRLAQASWEHMFGPRIKAVFTGRLFTEHRNNGTPMQQNESRVNFGSLTLSGTPTADTAWSAVVYGQGQRFSSFFSAVAPDRNSETPANNQYDVPATAAGASLSFTRREGTAATTVVGIDARGVSGETREAYLYQSGEFMRHRFAGGSQDFFGAFIHHDRQLNSAWLVSTDLRYDYWENQNGHRREYNVATGQPTLLNSFPDQSGNEFSPGFGLVWQPASNWRLRASAYRAFRLPTLNEYYRPFRVGNVTTDANPGLSPETLDGGEIGAEWSAGKTRISVTGFATELRDAVGNVTISDTPSGTTRQRQNLGAVRVRGVEMSARWSPFESVALRADYLYDDAIVLRAPAQPALVGLRLAQVPRHTLTAGLTWSAPRNVQADVSVRWVSAQYDDDQNTLRLAPATTVDFRLSRRLGPRGEIFAAMTNAFDATVETGRSNPGVATHDAPRMIRGGVLWRW